MIVKKNAYGYVNVNDISLLQSYEDFLIEYAEEIGAISTGVQPPQINSGGGGLIWGGGLHPITPGDDPIDIQPLRFVLDPDVSLESGKVKYRFSQGLVAAAGNGSSVNQTSTVYKDFVLDYTSLLKNVIMETETGGLTYRYTYGLEKLSAVVYGISSGAAGSVQQTFAYPNGSASVVKLWYHHDRLGTVNFLTDNVQGKVTSYVSYDDWGALTMKFNLQFGSRQLDLVTQYTVHPYDPVLGVYFAQARMYDAAQYLKHEDAERVCKVDDTDIENIRKQVRDVFVKCGFRIVLVNYCENYVWKEKYRKVAFAESLGLIIEYAETYEDAKNNLYEDGFIYPFSLKMDLIQKLSSDIIKYMKH